MAARRLGDLRLSAHQSSWQSARDHRRREKTRAVQSPCAEEKIVQSIASLQVLQVLFSTFCPTSVSFHFMPHKCYFFHFLPLGATKHVTYKQSNQSRTNVRRTLSL